MQLSQKVALVTGATTGIGFASAEKLLQEGVSGLIITGQDVGRLAEAKESLSKTGNAKVTAVRWRANVAGDTDLVADAIRSDHGHLDIIFANAGVTWPAPLGHIEMEAAQEQFLINTISPLILIQTLAPLMRDHGAIVLNTSCLDVLGMPGMAVYAASKAATRSLARTLSAELKERGIRVNAVAPGPTETPIYGKLGMSPQELEEMASGIVSQVPAGRFAKPEEIAGAVAYLASDASRYIVGEELNVDGGWANL